VSPPNRTRRSSQTASEGFRGEILAKGRVGYHPGATPKRWVEDHLGVDDALATHGKSH
jgi:hypothetical protein